MSAVEFCNSLWLTLADAESALHTFTAAQGWSANVCKSSKYRFQWLNEQDQPQLGEVVQHKIWICSRAHQKGVREVHRCSVSSDEAASSSCDDLNRSGKLASLSDGQVRLVASAKTGCSVAVRIAMVRKENFANGRCWTAEDSPCGGYRVSTHPSQLQPCQHNHPSTAARLSEQALTESVWQIPTHVREEIKSLVLAKFSSYRIRNFITQKHTIPPMLPAVWTSLVRSLKIEMGIQDAGDDLAVLVERLTSERNERGAVFDMQVDSFGDLTVSTIFFMSREMMASFRRCGQFVVMDSTCKTNRFGLNLFLVCGVDEHEHIALFAAAFMKEETQPRFEYVLRQLRRAVGEEAWMRMACVATDGCRAMTNALWEVAPHAEQQRCVWHLQQNIIKHAGGAAHQHVIAAWWKCVYAKTKEAFDIQWAELLQKKMSPKLSDYLVIHMLPLAPKWAAYVTGCFTNFGSHSTQLVESLNRLLKMWDANDRTSLSQAVQRICMVKDEEQTRKQIAAMRIHSTLVVAHGAAATCVQAHDTYIVKAQKMLSTAAAKLCEVQYNLYSQYRVRAQAALPGGPFCLSTRAYIVQHKVNGTSEHVVHISPSLIYCPCGYMFAYLLPCRHILAANGDAFADIFQPEQYHPRWLLAFTPQLQQVWLSKQFWISVGTNVTAEGLSKARYERRKEAREDDVDLSGGEGMDRDEEIDESGVVQAAAAASAALAMPTLPDPMFLPPSSLHPAEMSPQHLYHMIEGQCQQLRQLACSDPVRLSSMVWLGLSNLKKQVEQHIDHERRQQQQLAVSGSAALMGNLTSEGIPLSSLLAPVAVSALKAGRPSNRRAYAAVEGRAASKIRLMMPAAAALAAVSEGEDAARGAAASLEGQAEEKESQPRNKKIKRGQEVSLAACVAAAAVAASVAGATSESVAAGSAVFASSSSSSLPSASASASVAADSASAAPVMRWSSRVRVPLIPHDV
jgi:hypothetical protein